MCWATFLRFFTKTSGRPAVELKRISFQVTQTKKPEPSHMGSKKWLNLKDR
jgi:hypothetical protein